MSVVENIKNKNTEKYEATALTCIEVMFDDKITFSCKKGEVVPYEDIVFVKEKGYIIINNDVQLPLSAFAITLKKVKP